MTVRVDDNPEAADGLGPPDPAVSSLIRAVDLDFTALLEHDRHGLHFLGPTVRGMFGWLLKQTVCQVGHGGCHRCHLQSVCPYPGIFEGRPPADRSVMRLYPAIPQPFVLRVAEPGMWAGTARELQFGIRLFGPATQQWPYLIEAFRQAGEQGIGARRTQFRLLGVQDGPTGRLVWRDGETALGSPTILTIGAVRRSLGDRLEWLFETPLSLRKNGRPLNTIGGLDLVLAARRRWKIMTTFHGEAPAPADGIRVPEDAFETEDSTLRAWQIGRFSGRQQRRMPLHGLLGRIVIRGPWSEVGSWIHGIEGVHLGRHTSFGLGRARWNEV